MKLGNMSIILSSLLIPSTSSRVPKTTLKLNILLEGFTEFTESGYVHSHGLLWEEIQIKVSQGRDQSRKVPKVVLPIVLSPWSHGKH